MRAHCICCACAGCGDQLEDEDVGLIKKKELTVGSKVGRSASAAQERAAVWPCRCGLGHQLEDEDVVQIVKKKVTTGGEEGRGRFKSTKKEPARIADREKKAALKT